MSTATAIAPSPAPAGDTPAVRAPVARWIALAAVVVALIPIAVALVRALGHWLPIGDNAFFAIRARDVTTAHPPLLGLWSSASLDIGKNVNHPGPLYFMLLATPVRMFGSANGVAIGAALLNALAVGGIALVAWRRGGALLTAIAMALTAALCSTMGSLLLIEPWQPHSMVLVFLAFLMLAWAAACGDIVLLPWLVFAGSLLAQTHLSFAYFVPILTVFALASCLLELRRRRRTSNDVVARPRVVGGYVVAAVVVGALAWIPPIVEQIQHGSDGNLARLWSAMRASSVPGIGYTHMAKLLVTVVVLPPWWFRPTFDEKHFGGFSPLPTTALTVFAYVVLVAVLGGTWWFAHRRADRAAMRALLVVAIALLVALYTGAHTSKSFGYIAPHEYRWLWPLGVFLVLAVVATFTGAAAERGTTRSSAALVSIFALVTVGFAAFNLPTYTPATGPSGTGWGISSMRDIDRQLGAVRPYSPVMFRMRGLTLFEPYTTAIMAELQRRGIPFVTSDAATARQLGDNRKYNGHNARWEIFYLTGTQPTPPTGARVVAHHDALSAHEQSERRGLARVIATDVRDHGVTLTAAGRHGVAIGFFPTLVRSEPGTHRANMFVTGQLGDAIAKGAVVVPARLRATYDRFAALETKREQQTITVYVLALQ